MGEGELGNLDGWTPHGRVTRLAVIALITLIIGTVVLLAGHLPSGARRDRLDALLAADRAAAQYSVDVARTSAALERFVLDGTVLTDGPDLGRAGEALEDARTGVRGEAALLDELAADQDRYGEAVGPIAVVAVSARPGTPPEVDPAALAATRSELEELSRLAARFRSDLYAPAIADRLDDDERALLLSVAAALSVGGLGLTTMLVLAVGDVRALRRNEAVQAERDARSALTTRRTSLEASVNRALEMAAVENDAWTVVRRALESEVSGVGFEVMVADSRRAHFRRVAVGGLDTLDGGCQVGSPASCPAAQRGAVSEFPESGALDACPFLRTRDLAGRGAVCVPLSVAGNTVGVVHAVSEHGPVPEVEVDALALVATKAGDRVGLLRALADSQALARTDPLTGLLNRRSLRQEMESTVGLGSFAVLYIDVDHFKDLNDDHTHEIGDRALRLLGAVLRETIRPDDRVGRYGGEEFVIVAPGAGPEEGVAIAERVREALVLALHRSTIPHFTLSIGVAAATGSQTFEDALDRADRALLRAKAAGRNRVMLDGGEDPAPVAPEPVE